MDKIVKELLPKVLALAKDAGEKIVAIYEQSKPLQVEIKPDSTPLTEADLAAHKVIKPGLSQLTPEYPVLSEEGADIDYDTRQQWTRYWLVDPLDGTREFIHGTDEFTVNIALIDGQEAILGVVYVPVKDILYYAVQGGGAFKVVGQGEPQQIQARKFPSDNVTVVASRRHAVETLKPFYEKLGSHTTINMGSALKSCVIAEGGADIYPRLGPTSEWDTAASQCVVEEAGGKVMDTNGERLLYNTKASLLNPDFIVVGDKHHDWLQYFTDMTTLTERR